MLRMIYKYINVYLLLNFEIFPVKEYITCRYPERTCNRTKQTLFPRKSVQAGLLIEGL